MDDPVASSYDLIPYESHAFADSHPDNLRTIATLFGLSPAPIDQCRVLELGCASGGNIIPMACNLPGSEFTGIDLSARQIAMGIEAIKSLELTNIRLLHQAIEDVDPALGRFDYIIAHGVYSWVPEEIREKILSLSRHHLAADGVAYISYNTYPGWHMPEALREMMLYHVSIFKDAKTQTQQARALLKFLHEATADKTNAYSLFLKDEVETLARQRDYYIFHDILEVVNQPVYFHAFADQAAKHGLQYLGEASSSMSAENFPENIAKELRLAGDLVRREQYMDFLTNRRYRATLLCHTNCELTREPKPETTASFFISSEARPQAGSGDLENLEKLTLVVPGRGGATFTWNPILKATFPILWDNWPKAMAFGQLYDQVWDSLLSNEKIANQAAREGQTNLRQGLASNLLRLYLAGIVEFHGHVPSLVTAAGERPQVTPLARLQAQQNNWVTNQWHRTVVLKPFDRWLVQFLDGEHDRAALEAKMIKLVRSGKLIDDEGGDIDSAVQKVVERTVRGLQSAAENALLMA